LKGLIMKRSIHLMLSATLACCAAAAQAGTSLKAADLPRISNGGTGFIGVTESVGMKRPPADVQWSASGSSAIPLRAGEATTFVNGRPNDNPNAPAAGAMAGDHMQGQLRVMGGSGGTMSDFPAHAHRSWGTPD
jgi:hypothetical protein